MLEVPKFEVAGRFRVEAVRADGSAREICDWFDNLILNQGLDALAGRTDYLSYCQCGVGANAAQATDTQLQSRIAGIAADTQYSAQINTTDRYLYLDLVYTFPIGSATGNISELGIGWGATGTSLFSRALVKDASGNPITITVLADEQLRVYYQYRVYQPTTDFFAGTVGGYSVVGRSANIGSINEPNGWYLYQGGVQPRNRFFPSSSYSVSFSSGGIAAMTSAPSPAGSVTQSAGSTAYIAGTFSLDYTITVAPNDGNIAGGIGSIFLPFGPTCFQFGFTPKIPKTNVQELKIVLRYTWARRSV